MRSFVSSARAAFRFRDYKPQHVSFLSALRWIKQFKGADRIVARDLLNSIIYFSERKVREVLVEQNEILIARFKAAGIENKKVIYISVHDAGSSSSLMLNMLRDAANLERRGFKFVDIRDGVRLVDTMNKLGEGALVYVDDFLGTGNQFCGERDYAANSFIGTFSEFILAPCICEEALEKLDERGIEAFTGHKHLRSERPLLTQSEIFSEAKRAQAEQLCRSIGKFGLGYQNLATMVVLYRNAPNTLPTIFRGNTDQKPISGVFPRVTDLPVKNKY